MFYRMHKQTHLTNIKKYQWKLYCSYINYQKLISKIIHNHKKDISELNTLKSYVAKIILGDNSFQSNKIVPIIDSCKCFCNNFTTIMLLRLYATN